MRFAFKTTYDHDLGLFRDPVQRRWYAGLLAAVLLLPLAVPDYLVDISLVFIYGLCGLSLMVLAGYTGLVSLGTPRSSASGPTPTSTSCRISGCRGWSRSPSPGSARRRPGCWWACPRCA